jgi:hypothetical protein
MSAELGLDMCAHAAGITRRSDVMHSKSSAVGETTCSGDEGVFLTCTIQGRNEDATATRTHALIPKLQLQY